MQVVGYRPSPNPVLLLADGGPIERHPLEPGVELTYALGERRCAGTVQNDHHVPCTSAQAPHCRAHKQGFDESQLRERTGEHAVYFAAFAPATFKVGITRRDRLETRLREQGADRGAHVLTVPDGDAARDAEERLSTDLSQRVRVETKLNGLGRPVDKSAWERLLTDYDPLARFDLSYGLSLSNRPVAETMATGTVVGVKGRVLLLERGSTYYAVDLRDLVGHELLSETDDRQRQSSLGAFD
ncbi:DUF2797 domain-containing protein [Halosegnis sp.]|uniref:DUF2797 domain-containing protein n=1 Tax=Halosegnis sp. TaxID=2864959 RepID=UPI0035D3FD82